MSRKLTALVIGNAAYSETPRLQNPTHDAEDISARLQTLGFTVRTLTDATIEQMRLALVDFGDTLETSSVGLVFFAGHAFQIDGKNYLAAIDTKVNQPLQVQLSALDLDLVLTTMRTASAPTGFVILDACRNNPFEGRTRSGASNELATVYAPKGTLIAFSTSPGQTSLDGDGRNGFYTEALLRHIGTPNVLIETMFKRVRSTLESLTGGRQTSWEHTSLTGDFRFELAVTPGSNGYGSTATADSLFPRNNRMSGKVIQALKTYNWDKQNIGLSDLTDAAVKGSSPDELFVIGRNVYQAACGDSTSAKGHIAQFGARAYSTGKAPWKAILDGILYEIFFDSEGQHRAKAKTDCFADVFELQAYPQWASSFAFIRDCLLPYADQYLAIPGGDEGLSLTVNADPSTEEGTLTLNAVWMDSTNVLHQTFEDDLDGFGLSLSRTFSFPSLQRFISTELLIPERLLNVEANFPYTPSTRIVFPGTHTRQAQVTPYLISAADQNESAPGTHVRTSISKYR